MRVPPLPLRRGRFLPFVSDIVGGPETTKLSLKWSFTVTSTVAVTSVTGDEEDAWTVPLEWSFLVDLDPADDVEGDP